MSFLPNPSQHGQKTRLEKYTSQKVEPFSRLKFLFGSKNSNLTMGSFWWSIESSLNFHGPKVLKSQTIEPFKLNPHWLNRLSPPSIIFLWKVVLTLNPSSKMKFEQI